MNLTISDHHSGPVPKIHYSYYNDMLYAYNQKRL